MDKKKLLYFLPLLAFGLMQSISIAAGGAFLCLVVLSMLLYCVKCKVEIIDNNKMVLQAIAVFIGIMLISALASGDTAYSLKMWATAWIWHAVPFFAILLFNNKALTEKLMFFGVLGYSIDAINVISQGLKGMSRANGFFGHPMCFAGLSCITLPILLVCVLDENLLSKKERIAVGLMLVLGCVALIYNGTRGAWLSVAVAFAVIGCYYLRKNLKVLLIVLLGVGILAGVGINNKYFSQRAASISSVTDESNLERFRLWQASTRMFIDNPVLGVGTGRYPKEYQNKYVIRTGWNVLRHAHNNVLHILAEAGIIGAFAFLGMFFSLIKYGIYEVWQKKNPYGLMLACAVGTIFLQGMTEYNIGQSTVGKYFWYNIAALLVLCSKYEKDTCER